MTPPAAEREGGDQSAMGEMTLPPLRQFTVMVSFRLALHARTAQDAMDIARLNWPRADHIGNIEAT